jgi:hypothetical protein
VTQVMPPGSPWRGSLRDLTQIVNDIRRLRAFGRLTLRSTTHIGLAHLFFRGGKLVHIVSNSGDASATLADLQRWTRAVVHFERGIPLGKQNVNREHEQIFENLLTHLQKRSVAAVSENPRVTPASESPRMFTMPEAPRATSIPANPRAAPASESARVIESQVVATPGAERLITPQEWYVLVESIRRVSQAVAQLVGPQEAMSALRDILDDFSSAFPALSSLHVATGGYLQVVRTTQLDHIPRRKVIEGFAALLATCRHFCTPIIGEENARRLLVRALGDLGPALINLGIYNV